MKFFADGNVGQQIVAELRLRGHEVVYLAKLEPGLDEDSVLARSLQFGAVLRTADKDLGDMAVCQERAPGGVLLIRLAGVEAGVKAAWAADVADRHGAALKGAFAVLTSGRLRLRHRIS